jgi:hypothetical protein
LVKTSARLFYRGLRRTPRRFDPLVLKFAGRPWRSLVPLTGARSDWRRGVATILANMSEGAKRGAGDAAPPAPGSMSIRDPRGRGQESHDGPDAQGASGRNPKDQSRDRDIGQPSYFRLATPSWHHASESRHARFRGIARVGLVLRKPCATRTVSEHLTVLKPAVPSHCISSTQGSSSVDTQHCFDVCDVRECAPNLANDVRGKSRG